MARGIVSPVSDWIRGETPTLTRQAVAVFEGATMEVGGRIVSKFAGTVLSKIRARFVGEPPSVGAGTGPRKSPFNPGNGKENCVRCVTSLVDSIENGSFVLPADRYPGPINSWFKTPIRALQFIGEHTGVTFGKMTTSLVSEGDYVIFNRMLDGSPTHVLWARVRADSSSYFYDPQIGRRVAASSVGLFQAYPIVR